GNRLSMMQPNGAGGTSTTTYTYDADNRLTDVFLDGSNQAQAHYTFDSVGRNTRRQFYNGAVTNLTYDAEGRLTGETTTQGSGGSVLQSSSYGLDSVGNRVAETATGLIATYRYDAFNRLTNATYNFSPNGTPTTHNYSYL